MRPIRILPLLLLFAAYPTRAADPAAPTAPVPPPAPTLQFHIAGHQPDDQRKPELLRLGLELLKSSNFNTVQHAAILRQSIPLIQDHYRSAVTGDYILIRYDSPIAIHTVGGDIKVIDIIIGVARPDYASSLFTVDDAGRVVAHEKYSGSLAIQFRKALAPTPN